jgi:hypothetical protein
MLLSKIIKIIFILFSYTGLATYPLIAADCLVQTKMECLGNHALGEIQNWHDDDQDIVRPVRSILKAIEPFP